MTAQGLIPRLTWFSLLILVCYFPVIQNIVHQWSSNDDMSHGFFVPLIAGYVVWERRGDLAGVEVRTSRWGLAGVVLGAALAPPAHPPLPV